MHIAQGNALGVLMREVGTRCKRKSMAYKDLNDLCDLHDFSCEARLKEIIT